MNKFFKDDTTVVQEIPNDIIKELFPKFLEQSDEIQKSSNKWIVIKNGTTPDGLSYQVCIQVVFVPQNIFYHIFMFRLDGVLVGHFPVRAAQIVPPVSEKTFGLDYFDWLEIQGSIIAFLQQSELKPIELDTDLEGKMVYGTKETAKEVFEKIERGESYNILTMPAKEFVSKVQEKAKENSEEKSNLVVPDGNPNK